jgi:hypothetical protein
MALFTLDIGKLSNILILQILNAYRKIFNALKVVCWISGVGVRLPCATYLNPK